MGDLSTFRAQFLAELDRVRQLRKQLLITLALTPFMALLILLAAVLIHPLLLLLVILPVFFFRNAFIRASAIRCPKCGELFFVKEQEQSLRPGKTPALSNPLGIFGSNLQCTHCKFRL